MTLSRGSRPRSRICARSSPTYAPQHSTSSAYAQQSRRCSTATEQNGLTIEHEVTIPGRTEEDGRLDSDIETAVYRIVQEALTNIVKHANAEKVRLAVREHDGQLLVEIQDDGDGFDAQAVDHGFGLTGIAERVSLTGGELNINSDNNGTLLTVRLPARRAGKRDAGDQAELQDFHEAAS